MNVTGDNIRLLLQEIDKKGDQYVYMFSGHIDCEAYAKYRTVPVDACRLKLYIFSSEPKIWLEVHRRSPDPSLAHVRQDCLRVTP